jgi:excisionase family DNA binding protein
MAAQIPTADDIRAIVREELRAALVPASSDVLSSEQAASVAGVTPKTIRTWVETKGLTAKRRGRLLAIRRADLQAFLAGEHQRSPVDELEERLGRRA